MIKEEQIAQQKIFPKAKNEVGWSDGRVTESIRTLRHTFFCTLTTLTTIRLRTAQGYLNDLNDPNDEGISHSLLLGIAF